MFKKGFTLAEVLITLMIIGVVATLTTPALVKNVGSSKIGPQLSKFVNTWETAVESLMMDENTNSLNDAFGGSVGASGAGNLAKYIIMSTLDNDKKKNFVTNIVTSDGQKVLKSFNEKADIWLLKDGTVIYINPGAFITGYYYKSGGSYKGQVGAVLVDIGGIKGSHRAGREVFLFLIDDNGSLIPYGSNAHKSLVQGEFNIECSSTGSAAQAFACTGAVADNGWKAPW